MSSKSKCKEAQFNSEGFDLGAATDGAEGDGSIVYEIGGGVTTSRVSVSKEEAPTEGGGGPTDEAERLKALGNEEFKRGNYLDAYDYYTEAIDACPSGDGIGPTGEAVLRLRDEFEEKNRERMAERQRKEMERRRSRRQNDDGKNEGDDSQEEEKDRTLPAFTPPQHRHGRELTIYHANRAAALLHLGREEEAIEDCDVALLFNPTYAKAYARRSTLYERLDDTEGALRDAREACRLAPTAAARKNVARLERIENERLERLKEETMGKLKDLGNSILGNFGMSLDNFNAVQDPKTGGYSISYNQNAGKK